METINVTQLIQDDCNANAGTKRGGELMHQSLHKFGAGRSILVDKNNRIIAGNKTALAAEDAGIMKVRVIETTGDELIAVKRTDIDLDSQEGRELALADNATSKANLKWDEDNIHKIASEYDIATTDWGFKEDIQVEEELNTEGKDLFKKLGLDLASEMAEPIKEAIQTMIKTEAFKNADFGDNSNKNGNAIYLIVKQWAEQRK